MDMKITDKKLQGFNIRLKDIYMFPVKLLLREIFTVTVFFALYVKSIVFIKLCESDKGIRNIAAHLNKYNVVFIIVTIAIGYLFKDNLRRWYLFIVDLFWSILFVGDLIYINAFRMLPSASELKELASMQNEGNGFLSLLNYKYAIFFIDIIPLLILLILFMVKVKNLKEKYIINIIVFLVLIYSVHANLNTFYKTIMLSKDTYKYYATKVYAVEIDKDSIFGYHISDVYKSLNTKRELDETEKKEVKNWLSTNYENNPPNSYFGMFKNKNVIYLQVESLENFVINHSIDGQELTPNLNKIVKNSFYFDDFYEQVNGGTSSDADLLANASIYPIRSGSTFYMYQGTTYNTIEEILRKKNYYTMGIYSMDGSIWNWMPNMSTMGFDKLLDIKSLKDTENINLGISDKCLLNQSVSLIKQNPEPFFTDIITLTNHMPYILPDKYKELKFPDNLKSTNLAKYMNTVHYTDEAIGDFINGLDKAGLLDNTIVVIYGDHCGIHKYYPKQVEEIPGAEDWYKYYDHKIPLIIYSKGMKGEKIDTIGGQVDIMPTVLSLLGVDSSYYKDTAVGRNLLNTKKSFAVLSDSTVIGNPSPDEKQHVVDGLMISDLIIRSNYFKNNLK